MRENVHTFASRNRQQKQYFMAHNHHDTHCREHCGQEQEHHGHNHHGHGHDDCDCHGHGHEHHHHDESPRGQLVKIVVASLLLVAAVVVEHTTSLATWQMLLIYLIPYLVVGFGTIREAAEGIAGGRVFNEHFLMSVATVGALAIGFLPGAETQFPEAVFVMLFFQVGELFEGYAEGRSRKSIGHLMEIRPDTANVVRAGETLTVSPDEVAVGETIVIRPGERVPLDAVVLEGSTALNTVALTGESVPRDATVGDEIISGCINISGVVRARVTKAYGESTVSKIISLVENAADHKSHSEAFITRFARVYTPIVVFAALGIAVILPIISKFTIHDSLFAVWLYRALMFLVVSCPCALVISVPLSFFGGIGGASRRGILIKGANYMDILARVDTVVFDKTGTLTHGRFAVEAVHPEKCDENHLLHLAAHVEHFSTHPIGAALRDAFPQEASDGCKITYVEEIAGQGICARIENWNVAVGNAKLMDTIGAKWHDCSTHKGTIVHVAIDGEYAGHIVISDQIKDDSAKAVNDLKSLGVQRTVMLTGDREEVAHNVAQKLHLDEYHAQLLPQDKVQWMNGERKVAFVGDGINDAPVLALADVGIAMGGLGSDAAIEAADIVLMDDQPSKVATAIRISRRTLRIARQNVIFAIGVKLAVLILAAIGLATMWMAVFADVGVTVLAVFNAMRTLKTKD